MILEIDDQDAFKMLDSLRLTPLYVYLHMEDSEERQQWIPEDFKPHKWIGYENDHCVDSYNSYKTLHDAMRKAVDERLSEE